MHISSLTKIVTSLTSMNNMKCSDLQDARKKSSKGFKNLHLSL